MSTVAHRPSEAGSLRLRIGSTLHPLTGAERRVGRSRNCEIRVDDDSVSRVHAAFVWLDGAALVEDLGSSNGTFVNGERIRRPCVVRPGDLVRFGSLESRVEEASDVAVNAGAAPPTSDYTIGVIPGPPAGLGWRLLAASLNLLLFALGSLVPLAAYLAVDFLQTNLLAPGVSAPAPGVQSLVAGGCGALWVLYAWFFVIHGWARRGGTPGMRLCGLRLLDWQRRTPIGYNRAWLRLAATGVTVLTLGLGFFTIAFRRDRRALHDVLAGTQVAHRARAL
jgi:uncharacterized RDD family membrane protein YckC